MWFFAPLKHLALIGILANTHCIVLSQVSSTETPGTTAESRPNTVDPDGQNAWTTHGFSIEQRQNLREPFEWAMEKHFIPGGVMLVIHRGDVIFREGFGLADIETKRPFAIDAPCRIASVTKPHTATLIAMLVDQGKLAWDDPVDKYLPRFAKLKIADKGIASRPPKIRELLSHTAGFPGNDERRTGPPSFKTDGTLADAVDDLADKGLASEPGTVYAYTGLDLTEKPEATATFPTPGGGLISTLDDVGKMMMLHRNRGNVAGNTLIAKETLQALYRPQPATGRNGYGLGFNVMRTNAAGQGIRVRHTGASGTFALLDFQSDMIVVMLSQVPSKQTQPLSNRLLKAIEAVFAR